MVPGTVREGAARGRAVASDGGARAPRRRVQQGRRDHGALRGRGRRRAGRDLHGRRARQRAQPQARPARGAGRTSPRSAAPRWTRRGRSSASSRPGWASSTPGLPEGDPLPPLPEGCFGLVEPLEVAAAPLVRLMREFRPHVVTTYDENGGYPHPDHIMCHKVSVAAFDAAGDPERYPELGRAVAAAEALLQHRLDPRPGCVALHEAMLAAGLESPYAEWLEKWDEPRRQGRPGHHPGRVRRILRGPRRRAAGPRHPGRPGRLLVPGAAGAPAQGLADRGLRAGPVAGRQPGAGVRPVRRRPGGGARR